MKPLTKQKIQQIKDLYAQGVNKEEIGRRLEISRTTVHRHTPAITPTTARVISPETRALIRKLFTEVFLMREIAEKTGVAKSTVSTTCRDLPSRITQAKAARKTKPKPPTREIKVKQKPDNAGKEVSIRKMPDRPKRAVYGRVLKAPRTWVECYSEGEYNDMVAKYGGV